MRSAHVDRLPRRGAFSDWGYHAMSLSALFTPTNPAHPNLCDYGNSFFFFVPGDSGNPFAAVWQADLVLAAVLLTVGALVFWLGKVGRWQEIARRMGWVYIGGAAASTLLAVIAVTVTRPLACYGAPGAGSPTSADQRAYQVFQSVQMLSGLMVYLTLLLLVIFVIVLIAAGAWAVRQRVHGNVPTGA